MDSSNSPNTMQVSADNTMQVSGSSFASGSVLKERYRIEREIGKGGFGIVYEATDLYAGNQRVAVKTLKHNLDDYDVASKRFKREIELCQSIENIHAVKIFDDGIADNGTLFYVMEYLEGCALDTLIEKREKFTFRETKAILVQVLEALAEAHDKGIIHRDMKPANIWLTEKTAQNHTRNYDVKVLDFGIAKAIDKNTGENKLTQTGTWMGSPSYMSPEHLTGREVTPSSDIFAIGLIAIEMITNHLAVEGDTPMEIAMEIISQNDIYIEEWILNTSFGEILANCVKKLPSARYKNARELLDVFSAMDDDNLRNEFNEAKLRRKTSRRNSVVLPAENSGQQPESVQDNATQNAQQKKLINWIVAAFCIVLIALVFILVMKLINMKEEVERNPAEGVATTSASDQNSTINPSAANPQADDHKPSEDVQPGTDTAQEAAAQLEKDSDNADNKDTAQEAAAQPEKDSDNADNKADAQEAAAQPEENSHNLENENPQKENDKFKKADAENGGKRTKKNAEDAKIAAQIKTETAQIDAQLEAEQALKNQEQKAKQEKIEILTSELKAKSTASDKCLTTCLRDKSISEILSLKGEKSGNVPNMYIHSNGKTIPGGTTKESLEAIPNVKLCKNICS